MLLGRSNNFEILCLLQRHAVEGVEFSASSSTSAVGVLVPVTERGYSCEFLTMWARSHGEPTGLEPGLASRMGPRFIRCDFEGHERWRAVTVYGDMEEGDCLKNRIPSLPQLPVFCHSVRFDCTASTDVATYFCAKGVAASGRRVLLDAVADQLGFGEAARWTLGTLSEQLCRLGWLQCVAVSASGHKVKLDVATNRMAEVIRTIAEWDPVAADRLHRVIRILGGAIGYAATTVTFAGNVSWRVYSRPFVCRRIDRMLEKIL